jgi:hypothetical protein
MWFRVVGGIYLKRIPPSNLFFEKLEKNVKEFLEEVERREPFHVCVNCEMKNLNIDVRHNMLNHV